MSPQKMAKKDKACGEVSKLKSNNDHTVNKEYSFEITLNEIPCFFDDSLFDYEKMKVNYKKAVELQKEYPFLRINAQIHLLFGVL